MWVTKLLFSPVKKKDSLPKNDQIWPQIGIFVHFAPGLASSFGALLVGWLVVVARAVSRKTPIYFIYSSRYGRVGNVVFFSSSTSNLRTRAGVRL